MDMIDMLYGRTVKGIPLISVPMLLEDIDNCIFRAGSLFIKYNNKIIPFGCIKDLYLDPKIGKKLNVPKISNACLNVRTALNISCNSQDCINCHKVASEKAFCNELKLIKNS